MTTLFSAPQAVSSPTFTPPPLDGSLSIPEIYDFHYKHSAEHPLFVFDNENGEVEAVSWKEAVRAVHTAARIVKSHVEGTFSTRCSIPEQDLPVIAIFAVIDQLSYFALTAGIIRAGYRAFPISPRNSDLGVANLLQKMNVRHVFVSKDHAIQQVFASAREKLLLDGVGLDVHSYHAPLFDILYTTQEGAFDLLPTIRSANIDDSVLILHSSGSTSFPKPIVLSHRNLIQWGSQPYYGEVDICGRILSNHALPFFHAMGVVSLSWAMFAGITVSNFRPSDPPIASNPERLYTSATATRSRMIFCVPAFLEEWSQDEEKVEMLSKFDAVLFGGAPIQRVVGEKLFNKGVHLYPFYGATEIGGTSRFLPKRPPKEGWEYFKISPHAEPSFVDQHEKENVFQLLFQECRSHKPAVINTQISNKNAYDTNDLLIRHPVNPELWKIYGRADDQIMHSTGEKTNPVPMETIINRNPMVASCVIFGRGRFQAGVLVEPTAEHAFDPHDLEKLAAFRNSIWSSVEKANDFAPSHSRIFKEIILVAHPSKPFQYTPKGTPRRQVIFNDYEKEIDEGYAAMEESSQPDIAVPERFDAVSSMAFVEQVVKSVLSTAIRADDDFFQNGCDSLQATWIRNTVLHALRTSTKVSTRNIPINFVYANPTITRLSKYIARLTNQSADAESSDQKTETLREMNSLVEKYAKDFIKCEKQNDLDIDFLEEEAVLLTGSTGSLGSHILERLILDDNIKRVYALNRKSVISAAQRQEDAFKERDIDITLLQSSKLAFVEGDTSLEMLGLPASVYAELLSSVSCIIHSAWRVDFNVAITSMEPLIAGTRNLIDFALRSHRKRAPRFIFTSSIGVVRNWTAGFVPEASLSDPSIALGSGYPESKWVAERILAAAAAKTPLRPVIVRIGQLSGAKNGCWNPVEWVPSIARSGQVLGCLPRASGVVSWIPVHVAASALVEMRLSPHMFLHLVHPEPVSWSHIFDELSQILQVRLVSYSDWLTTLESSDNSSGSSNNPALRLLEFYQSADKPLPSEDAEAFGFPRLSTDLAIRVSMALQHPNLPPLGRQDAQSWVNYWRMIGFLDS